MTIRVTESVDGWYTVGAIADLTSQSTVVWIGARKLVVALVDERWVCFSAVCPHRGGPLERGEIVNGVVTCPLHGWGFCLTGRGKEIHGHEGIEIHEANAVDGILRIRPLS